MGNYIEGNLAKDEKIIIQAQVSWLSQFWYIVFGIVLVPFGIGILFLIAAFINVWTTELALTNRRIIAKSGLIRRNTIELKVNRVESLGVNQGVLGRMLGFGSIVVKGIGGSHAPINFISSPMNFRKQVNQHLDEIDDIRNNN